MQQHSRPERDLNSLQLWAHMLGYSCLLMAANISLSALSVLIVILQYIRCTALKWVKFELGCDVVYWGCGVKWKTRFGFNLRVHSTFPVMLWFFIYLIHQIHLSLKQQMQIKGKRLQDITVINPEGGQFKPWAYKGLQVNIRKGNLCCGYCAYASTAKRFSISPGSKITE